MADMHALLTDARCTICGQETPEIAAYGGRYYCPAHLHRFSENTPPLWRASTLTFGLLLLGVAGAGITNLVLPPATRDVPRLAIGIGYAVLPALIWLLTLYQAAARGRMEISPLLPTVFVLAALIAAAVTHPFLSDVLALNLWLTRTSQANRLLGNILINGSVNVFALYAIVRYTVWHTPIFTRRTDGILYALAAGWGYVTAINLLFVLDLGGLTLLNGSLRLVSQTCAYLAPSLVIGFVLGHNRFENLPFTYLPAGMTVAGILNGVLLYTASELNSTRLDLTASGFSPWPGVVVNLIALAGTFWAIYGLLRRYNALTDARLGQA